MSYKNCQCDYSNTCDACRTKQNAANTERYLDEVREWTVEAITELAKKLKVEIPKPPEKPGKW